MTSFGHIKEKHQIHNTKRVCITNALSETMRISFNETVCFDNCYIFKSHAVEPGLSLNLHYFVLELYLQQKLQREAFEGTVREKGRVVFLKKIKLKQITK